MKVNIIKKNTGKLKKNIRENNFGEVQKILINLNIPSKINIENPYEYPYMVGGMAHPKDYISDEDTKITIYYSWKYPRWLNEWLLDQVADVEFLRYHKSSLSIILGKKRYTNLYVKTVNAYNIWFEENGYKTRYSLGYRNPSDIHYWD